MYYTKIDREPETEVLEEKFVEIQSSFSAYRVHLTSRLSNLQQDLIQVSFLRLLFWVSPRLELLHVRVWMSIGSPLMWNKGGLSHPTLKLRQLPLCQQRFLKDWPGCHLWIGGSKISPCDATLGSTRQFLVDPMHLGFRTSPVHVEKPPGFFGAKTSQLLGFFWRFSSKHHAVSSPLTSSTPGSRVLLASLAGK